MTDNDDGFIPVSLSESEDEKADWGLSESEKADNDSRSTTSTPTEHRSPSQEPVAPLPSSGQKEVAVPLAQKSPAYRPVVYRPPSGQKEVAVALAQNSHAVRPETYRPLRGQKEVAVSLAQNSHASRQVTSRRFTRNWTVAHTRSPAPRLKAPPPLPPSLAEPQLVFSICLSPGRYVLNGWKTHQHYVRMEPSTSSKAIGTLKRWDYVDVVQIQNSWGKLVWPTQEGGTQNAWTLMLLPSGEEYFLRSDEKPIVISDDERVKTEITGVLEGTSAVGYSAVDVATRAQSTRPARPAALSRPNSEPSQQADIRQPATSLSRLNPSEPSRKADGQAATVIFRPNSEPIQKADIRQPATSLSRLDPTVILRPNPSESSRKADNQRPATVLLRANPSAPSRQADSLPLATGTAGKKKAKSGQKATCSIPLATGISRASPSDAVNKTERKSPVDAEMPQIPAASLSPSLVCQDSVGDFPMEWLGLDAENARQRNEAIPQAEESRTLSIRLATPSVASCPIDSKVLNDASVSLPTRGGTDAPAKKGRPTLTPNPNFKASHPGIDIDFSKYPAPAKTRRKSNDVHVDSNSSPELEAPVSKCAGPKRGNISLPQSLSKVARPNSVESDGKLDQREQRLLKWQQDTQQKETEFEEWQKRKQRREEQELQLLGILPETRAPANRSKNGSFHHDDLLQQFFASLK